MLSKTPFVVKAAPDVVAVHKPAGMPFHTIETNQPGLLATLRQDRLIQQQLDVHHVQRLFAVHRLDTATSGLVLFATSKHVAGLVAKSFRERRVHKYYLALSNRKPSKKQGSVIGDMARGRSSTWKLLRSTNSPAVTRFWSTSLAAVQPGLRLYLLKPETGRTHQLRVAMKCIGAPILGDALYGTAAAAQEQGRMYLHAAAIRLQLPNGEWFQAVDVPCQEGQLFQHPEVQQECCQLLPDGLDEDLGPWFLNNKLLTSCTTITDAQGHCAAST